MRSYESIFFSTFFFIEKKIFLKSEKKTFEFFFTYQNSILTREIFGKEWFKVAADFGLERLALYGPSGDQLPGNLQMAHWRLGIYKISSDQLLIVSSQAGYSGPPGEDRIQVLRGVLSSLNS